MRRVLFDTNVLLDVLLKRKPLEEDARWVVGQVEKDRITGLLGATTATTIYYVAGKALGQAKTRRDLQQLFRLFEVASVDRAVLEAALALDFSDYEDAVLHEAGRRVGAEAVVTRNKRDFAAATLAVYTPTELRIALQHRSP